MIVHHTLISPYSFCAAEFPPRLDWLPFPPSFAPTSPPRTSASSCPPSSLFSSVLPSPALTAMACSSRSLYAAAPFFRCRRCRTTILIRSSSSTVPPGKVSRSGDLMEVASLRNISCKDDTSAILKGSPEKNCDNFHLNDQCRGNLTINQSILGSCLESLTCLKSRLQLARKKVRSPP